MSEGVIHSRLNAAVNQQGGQPVVGNSRVNRHKADRMDKAILQPEQ